MLVSNIFSKMCWWMLQICKAFHDVTSPSPTQQAITSYHWRHSTIQFLIQGLTCGHRLAWPSCLNDAHACPIRCSHMWPPDAPPQECCQKDHQELEYGNSGTKQPLSNWHTKGLFRRRQMDVHWLLLLGPGTGQCWAQTSPRMQPGRKAASQSHTGSPGFYCISNSREIQLLIQEFFRTPHSQSRNGSKELEYFWKSNTFVPDLSI